MSNQTHSATKYIQPSIVMNETYETDIKDPLYLPILSCDSFPQNNSTLTEPRTSGSSGRRVTHNVEEIRSYWNMFKIWKKLGTTEQCVRFCEERGLIRKEMICNYHKKPMALLTGAGAGQFGVFQCRKSNCRNKKKISRASGTWFANVRLAVHLIFQVMYMFSQHYTYLQVQMETARDTEESVLSAATIADWFAYCRETIIVYELETNQSHTKIGGPGKIVEIDESKFGKRKYNKGRHIEGYWVIGMIEDGSDDLRLELCPDNDISAEVLVPLIQKHVEHGTEIHTDFWRAYDCLPENGYIHKKVYHSDPENRHVVPDGKHTQRKEKKRRYLKVMFNRDQHKSNFADWLVEYSWRRKIRIEHKDPYEELLKAILHVYTIEEM